MPIRDSAEVTTERSAQQLDVFRKQRLAEHNLLTMTGMYNALERRREVDAGFADTLSERERQICDAGLIAVLGEIHDDIDRAVFRSYGWEDLIPALVGKPGATTPSPYKTPEQEAAEEELLGRLVKLNQERAAEERRGIVRWLRPDYQLPKLRHKLPQAGEGVQTEAELPLAAEGARKWPADGLAQIRVVRDLLERAPAPVAPDALADAFDGRRSANRTGRVRDVLALLVETGAAREDAGRYFLPR